MRTARPRSAALLTASMLAALLALGCDRAVEPYVPGEQPESPDLSRIFPEGAERAPKDTGAPMAAGRGTAPGMPGAPTGRGAPPVAGGAGAPITGTIQLAPGLASRVPPGALLFLIARRGEGAGPPLAVKRIESPRFPLEFSLGPGDRMIQAMPFEGPLELSARLDTDGNAMTRAAGDMQGKAAGTHEPGESGVEIVIDQVL